LLPVAHFPAMVINIPAMVAMVAIDYARRAIQKDLLPQH